MNPPRHPQFVRPLITALRSLSFILIFSVSGKISAQAVRVVTYDAAAARGAQATNTIEQAAGQLKKLAPDVILLRGVTGWKMCSQLAEALKPADYRVAVCSAFRDSNGSNAAPVQVGILARNGAYFSWSEAWAAPTNAGVTGGFAFAAVQVAGHRFGFCSAEFPAASRGAADDAAKQWLETLGSFRGWANNKLEGFVTGAFGPVSTNGEAGRLVRSAGFVDALSWTTQPGATETVESHLVPDAGAPGGLLLTRWPMTCDFDFHPAPVVVVAANSPLPTNRTDSPTMAAARPVRFASLIWPVAAGLALVLVAIIFMLISIRRRLSGLQAQNALLVQGPMQHPSASLGYNVSIAAPALPAAQLEVGRAANAPAVPAAAQKHSELRQGVFAHLSHWLKEAFVQRLLADRKELLETQQAATLKVLAVDQRLARLELKIQQETASYEKQIEQLNRELLTAREENLELIRGQIKLLKAEMEDARKRVLEAEEA